MIWERSARTLVGGSKPLVFDQSADASAQITVLQGQSQRVADNHRKPLPTFDVVTVTV